MGTKIKYLKTSKVLYLFYKNLQKIYIEKKWPKVYGIQLNFLDIYENEVWVISDFKSFQHFHKYEKYLILK
jgi:hypothetical protein